MKNPVLTPAAIAAAVKGDLENFITAATPGGIEQSERAGQIEQSFLDTLPIQLNGQDEQFKKLGFVLGEPIDNIFRRATFPKGWRKKPTEHSMWSEIIDDKGRKRGMIFYKAAFYDRCAHASLDTRLRIADDYGWKDHKLGPIRTVSIGDQNGQVQMAHSVPVSEGDAYHAAVEEKKKALRDWLNQNYPQWEDSTAYWD